MKWIGKILAAFILLMAAALVIFLVTFGQKKYKERDMVYFNDLLYELSDDYKAGASIEELEKKYECDIVLRTENISLELTDYYSKGAMVLDLSPDGEYIGKVVWNDHYSENEKDINEIKRLVITFWTVILIVGSCFIFLIYFTLIKPVNEMNEFASEIAKGNLDIELPIHKRNLFGTFTESFDMMREALRASREREIESEKARKELVAALSHDIKTPVATIKAACEVLDMQLMKKAEEGNPDASNMLDKVQIISSKADLIDGLVSNIFHATLEELEKIEVSVKEENSTLIEEYLGRTENSGNVILENHIPRCLVYLDRIRMEQVIDNIIGNSRKYADTDIRVNFSEITVEGGKSENKEAGNYIKIKISDNGPGVPEEELPLITEKYYRGSDVRDITGYGLGMYLVKLYMDKQKGGIEYYNDNGFVVELLVKKV